ncbi:MAG: hypothetical protein AAB697_00115 [Patescibacteria group bacterium]
MTDVYSAGDPPAAAQPGRAGKGWWKEVIDKVLVDTGEEPRKSLMGAYCVYPGSRFITQQEDEEIVLLLRAHPITNIGWVLLTLVMLILPGILLSTGIFAAVPGKFILVGRLTWYLVTLMYAMERFLYWHYSVFIVTNERLVDIDFENLMYRTITYANLNHIEEPAMMTGGFIRSMFQYGDVVVTTASEQPTIEALGVPWPQKVVDIISRLAEELEKRRAKGE